MLSPKYMSLNTIQRAITHHGSQRDHPNAFDAVADYDKSRSAGVAGTFTFIVLPWIINHFHHETQKEIKQNLTFNLYLLL